MAHSRDRVRIAVVAVVVLALVARVVGLGSRPFHWDEARVGYWTLRYAETGVYEYRPVAGGPLLYHAGKWLVRLGGASDWLARLPVALVGGLLPAAALLFRGRLRDDETVATAVVLAFCPLLVYYGRFLRADLIAAAAALAAVGTVLRWVATDRDRYLYAAAALVAVAAATSGFAVATLFVTVVAGVVTVDHRRVTGAGGTVPTALAARGGWLVERATPLARALFVFLGTWALLFAPRGAGLLADPVALAERTYVDPVHAFLAVRVANRAGTEFIPFLSDGVSTLLASSAPLFLVAVGGFLADRYGVLGGGRRPIVEFTAVWAGLGVVAYPVVAEVVAPWTLVHLLVPLSVPAGVGLALVVRWGSEAVDAGDAARATAALLLLLAVGVHAGVVLADDVYGPSSPDASTAQFGQPADDLEPLAAEMEAALAGAEGANARVVYVGERYYLHDESVTDRPPITPESAREAWGERLPLPWYTERAGAATDSVTRPADLSGEPAVVIADPAHETEVADRLPDHEAETVRLGLWNREVVVFVAT
ncbi:TIGR03663 family protein [Haloparvum alkalitolerans]|uniref:flippase activity-associated protein Agl23 n=1 Tax=Haloparvum alkalitolerans TaxID=1042953 RepID=UPI003CEDA1B4